MPRFVRLRYEQYKRDTKQFTTWLAQTAISLGYPLDHFDESDEKLEEVVLTANAKKNARKKAKAKEKAKLKSGSQIAQVEEEGGRGTHSAEQAGKPRFCFMVGNPNQ